MSMTIPNNPRRTETLSRNSSDGEQRLQRALCGGLEDTPASALDRDALLAHLGREVLHASIGRDFSKAYFRTQDDKIVPRMYRVNSEALAKCQYVMLTNKQYAAVLVVDIDQPGETGGHPINLHEDVRETLFRLVTHNIGPAWVGINPQSGKAQAIWLIDPVYADKTGKSPAMSLLAATSRALGDLLDHDPHFAHRFSRSPFYEGNDPKAYRWYCQHKRVHRLADLIREIRDMTGTPHHEKRTHQQFTSGRELINAVRTRREEAQRFKQLAHELDAEMGDGLDQYDPELIDGVRVLWISEGIAARDETAFRHALKTAHRLRNSGQRMTDAALIDAYEHAYNIAQHVGGARRASEMPSMRDRQTMARRVRGYATQSKNASQSGFTTSGSTTTSERKALATMGRRGGKKAAERWEDRESEYAKGQLEKLARTHRKKRVEGQTTRARIQMLVGDTYVQTGTVPARKQIMEETGLSRATVTRHLAALRAQGLIPET